MLYLLLKAGLSGLIVALVSEISRRNPGLGGLVASLPLVSILGMVWLWSDTRDPVRLADHAAGTLVFVLPSLPMFALMPWLLRRGGRLLAGAGGGLRPDCRPLPAHALGRPAPGPEALTAGAPAAFSPPASGSRLPPLRVSHR